MLQPSPSSDLIRTTVAAAMLAAMAAASAAARLSLSFFLSFLGLPPTDGRLGGGSSKTANTSLPHSRPGQEHVHALGRMPSRATHEQQGSGSGSGSMVVPPSCSTKLIVSNLQQLSRAFVT